MKKNPFFKLIGLFAIMGLVAASILILLNSPLGPHLQIVPSAAEASSLQSLTGWLGDQIAARPAKPSALFAPLLQNEESACGWTGKMTLLILGMSRTPPEENGGVGSVRLAGVDFDESMVTILALHPLTWVQTPTLEKEGIEAIELSKAFQYAREFAEGQESALNLKATEVVAQTLASNFDFVPDRYVTVDPEVFASIVDQLQGGLVIDVPRELDATDEGYGTFDKGLQTMNGQQALDYFSILRPNDQRAPDEWARFKRQNQVAQALMEAVIRPENGAIIADMLKDFHAMVITDLSLSELRALNCMVREVNEDAVLLEVEKDSLTTDDQGRLSPDVDAIKQLIHQMTGD